MTLRKDERGKEVQRRNVERYKGERWQSRAEERRGEKKREKGERRRDVMHGSRRLIRSHSHLCAQRLAFFSAPSLCHHVQRTNVYGFMTAKPRRSGWSQSCQSLVLSLCVCVLRRALSLFFLSLSVAQRCTVFTPALFASLFPSLILSHTHSLSFSLPPPSPLFFPNLVL